ncbi:MAG: hypothetical protein WC476_10535 [Phycisphaerae bacterium]
MKKNLKIKVQSEKLLNCFAETCFYHRLKIIKLAGFGFGVDAFLIDSMMLPIGPKYCCFRKPE